MLCELEGAKPPPPLPRDGEAELRARVDVLMSQVKALAAAEKELKQTGAEEADDAGAAGAGGGGNARREGEMPLEFGDEIVD